jgi:hypothetical protein
MNVPAFPTAAAVAPQRRGWERAVLFCLQVLLWLVVAALVLGLAIALIAVRVFLSGLAGRRGTFRGGNRGFR